MNAVLICILVGGFSGNVAGLVLRNLNLGLLRNSVIGAFGGFIGFSIVSDLEADIGLFSQLAIAAAGGVVLTAIVGAVMNLRSR